MTPLNALLWRMRRSILIAALAMAVSVALPFSIAVVRFPAPLWAVVVGTAVFVACLGIWLERRWRRTTQETVTLHLNRCCPELQESAQLLLEAGDELSLLEHLQRQRVDTELGELNRTGELARRLFNWHPRTAVGVALASLAASTLIAGLSLDSDSTLASQPPSRVASSELAAIEVIVRPPAYTQRPERRLNQLQAVVEEGAQLEWTLAYDAPVDDVRLLWDDDDVLAQAAWGDDWVAKSEVRRGGIYRVAWRDATGERYSDFHRLQLTRDQPPSIELLAPNTNPLIVAAGQPPVAPLSLIASDDYGLLDAKILATVARGAGEGVRFRDVEIPFDRGHAIGTRAELHKAWQLSDLGMEPGDELYFRVVVSDNRQPRSNSSQTAVMMVRWESEDAASGLAIAGIAVDLLPEYFRSQRQIIIETEQLIAEAETVSAARGNDRSRGLAFDQKALRIRYGQYLGEEYTSDIGLSGDPIRTTVVAGHSDESFAQHAAHAQTHQVESAPGLEDEMSASWPDFMDNFVHSHDSAEQATLFDEATKGTLKAALAAMWQAELALHLSRPQQALPHEYQALDFLKQVQQANRIYVRRVGFEPPALDEGKRLSGTREDVSSYRLVTPMASDAPSALSTLIQLASETPGVPNAELRSALVAFRDTLGEDDIDLRLALAGAIGDLERAICQSCRQRLVTALWGRLPRPDRLPDTRHGDESHLGEVYMQTLQQGRQ